MAGNEVLCMHIKSIRKNSIRFTFLVLFFLFLAHTGLDASTIYYHKDEEGVMHFTDTPDSKDYEPMHLFGRESNVDRSTVLRLIKKYSNLYGVDASLVRAVLQVESSFDNQAVSSAGAQGLMQIMPETQKHLKLSAPFDPEANIEAGIRYLNRMLKRFSSVRQALAAYNAGPSKVEEYEGMPPYPETRRYVKKVLDIYKKFQD